mmetsp:Transcript_70084/g.116389  ORF Transcript_70084/g.116389 Transcript_70084/m.116389 type:complete len:86 (+) Transcript_70084:136-393(+)
MRTCYLHSHTDSRDVAYIRGAKTQCKKPELQLTDHGRNRIQPPVFFMDIFYIKMEPMRYFLYVALPSVDLSLRHRCEELKKSPGT